MSKSVVRSVKNVTKGYSSVQVKVRNATSNDAWGPSGTEMSEIAQMTFNNSNDFYEIMDMLDKRLNDKGKNWRHVLKSLKVLDYCLHEGSELVVTWARKNIYIIRTLREFQYIEEDGRDVGQNVRQSAKELTSLIMDESRLRAERKDRKSWKSRVTGLEEFGPTPGLGENPDTQRSRKSDRRAKRTDENDLEYQLALEASKNEAEEDRKRREQRAGTQPDDEDLAKAIKLSKEEEDLRRKELEQANASSLFDDAPLIQPAQSQPTGWNQGYQQQGAVDFSGNPIDPQQQQQQTTGYLNNAYAQPMGMPNQQTGFQGGYAFNPYNQPQNTGFDPFQFQQPQANFMAPQQTAILMNNPYAQQSNDFTDQSQQGMSPQSVPLQSGSHNPWSNNNADPFENLKPQPTGSNNPFASAMSVQQTARQPNPLSLDSLSEQKAQTQFTSPQSSVFAAPRQQQPLKQQSVAQNPHHAQLNALLATGEGQDTFGNVGNLRIPAQHTAPGIFNNSAGSGIGRMQANQTGNNPFFQHNQFTGMGTQQQPQHGGFMMPAQTGPAATFGGFGSSNPFGGAQVQAQRQGQQGGSLIDL